MTQLEAIPNLEDSLAWEQRHGSGAYAFRGITLVRGRGAHLWDDRGRRYLDCVSGHGAAILGHAHPAVIGAIEQQCRQLMTCPGSFTNDVRARFLKALATHTQFPRFFLCNSGTEAVEGALKLAILATGRERLLAVRGGYHGRTLGALASCSQPKLKRPWQHHLPPVSHLPLNDPQAAEGAIDDETAAVLVEPIQGEGGVRPADPEYLRTLRRLCDASGACLIFDEVQTGFGRTGKLLAGEHAIVRPDLAALAKGIAAGFPMGAVAIGPKIGTIPAGLHGSTFGGNPLAAAVGLVTLDTLVRERLPQRAEHLGDWALGRLRRDLEGLPGIRKIRGQGLMLGIDLRFRVGPILKALAEEERILALPAGPTVLRLLPPLVIDEEDWRQAVRGIILRLRARLG